MTFRMIVQLWNTNTSVFVSCDADLTENYMYISMKFGTGVHVFCWEVDVFNRSSFQSVSYKVYLLPLLYRPQALRQLDPIIFVTNFPILFFFGRGFMSAYIFMLSFLPMRILNTGNENLDRFHMLYILHMKHL